MECIDSILSDAINTQYYCQYLAVSSPPPKRCHTMNSVRHKECLHIATESLKIAQNRSKIAQIAQNRFSGEHIYLTFAPA